MKRAVSLLIAITMAVSMASCGGSSSNTGSAATQTANTAKTDTTAETGAADETVSEPEPATGEKITLNYLNWNGGEEMRIQQEFFNEYMAKNPNIEIKGQWVTENYESKINTLIAADQAPDIYYINEYLAVEWGEKGVALDLAPLFKEMDVDMKERYVDTAIFGTEDKIYGLSNGPVCLLLYYNKPLFEKHGVSIPSMDPYNPWTWDQFIEAAKLLTFDTEGNNPDSPDFKSKQIKTYGANAPTFWLFVMPLLYSNDSGFGTADGTASGLNTPAGAEVIQAISDMINVHKVSPDAAIAKNLPGTTQMFKNEQMAMTISGTWEYQNFMTEDIEFGVAPLPMFKTPKNQGWAATNQIAASTAHPKEAAQLLYALADCEQNPTQLLINFPNVKAYYTDTEKSASWLAEGNYLDDFKAIIPAIMTDIAVQPENVTLRNFNKLVGEIAQAEMDKTFAGRQTAEEAGKAIEEQSKGLWQGAW